MRNTITVCFPLPVYFQKTPLRAMNNKTCVFCLEKKSPGLPCHQIKTEGAQA